MSAVSDRWRKPSATRLRRAHGDIDDHFHEVLDVVRERYPASVALRKPPHSLISSREMGARKMECKPSSCPHFLANGLFGSLISFVPHRNHLADHASDQSRHGTAPAGARSFRVDPLATYAA